jgi:two-component system, NtrC family, sensor kinase
MSLTRKAPTAAKKHGKLRRQDLAEALAEREAELAEARRQNARLFDELQAKTRDLSEALQQQSATADVLKVISRSAFDLDAVFDALLASAVSLIGGRGGTICVRDGEVFRYRADAEGRDSAMWRYLSEHPATPGRASVAGRVLLSGKPDTICDTLSDSELKAPVHALTGSRSVAGVPLLRDDLVEGALMVGRAEAGPFDSRHIELLQTFADQAVIAIENARLFDEVQARTRDLSDALQQQTATADVLKVISRSAFDLQAVLGALVRSVLDLCDASGGNIHLRDGETFRLEMQLGWPAEFAQYMRDHPIAPGTGSVSGRAILTGAVAHIPDVLEDRDYSLSEGPKIAGYRALLGVPLLRQDEVIGVFSVGRPTPGPFTERQIELVRTFADQAVIAVENARLFNEVKARTEDLSEALQQQTATADVLKAISRTAFDLDTVLETLISTATRLCDAKYGEIFRRYGNVYRYAASVADLDPAYVRHEQTTEIRPGRGTLIGRVALENRTVEIADAWNDPEYVEKEEARLGNVRAMLGVPLMRDGEPIGAFALARSEPVPFTRRQVELVTTFADQAVIAIENVRLFDEVQARTHDLAEALQMRTATSDVLKVISRSAFDLQAVFNTLVSSAVELSGALTGTICVREGDVFRYRDTIGAEHTSALAQYLRDHPAVPGRSTIAGRVLLSGKVERIPDCLADPEYVVPMGSLASNVRSLLGVPLLRKDGVEGAIILTRDEAGHFSDRQVEIVQTFADQAVIALENVRLFDEVQARTRELAASLDDLRKAQDRLIQSEKLASLGQLTAGIAHEIKNPLNFVNNFSALSRELIGELADAIKGAPLDEAARKETDELIGAIGGNLDKVVQHGKRADSIVKNMLLHSREGSGERSATNINAMVEEALNLAYHGARAEKPGFNVTIAKSLDPNAGAAEVYAQEMTRVLLNLISNGFYATNKRKQSQGDGAYEPAIAARTRDRGASVEIEIRDNGTGIPDEVKAKMFNPFFTTKPAGEGTGLGLSLSHDIVVKQHGGTIEVSTEPGAFTQFTIVLPRGAASA